MCINRGGCNVRSGDEYRLAPTHVTLDIPFQLVRSCSCPVSWKQAVLVSAWLAGPRQVPSRCLDRRPRHCTAQYGTTRHETPCDRRHTDALTKVLTTRLGKPSGSRQTRWSPGLMRLGPPHIGAPARLWSLPSCSQNRTPLRDVRKALIAAGSLRVKGW